MKILFCGDPHLKITRFDLARQFLTWFDGVVEEVKPDLVVNLGDTWDNHAIVRSEITKEFKDHLEKILARGIPYYYVIGNHDTHKPADNKYHALQPFMARYEGLTVVDQVMELSGMTFVPFQPNIATFPKETKPICIAHQVFLGADYGYVRPDEGVDPTAVSADIIISGHIHTRQMFGKVVYPGTPYAQSVNDVDQSKGVMIFDTDTYRYSFVECPLPQWKTLIYDLSEFSVDHVKHFISSSVDTKNHWIVDITGPRAEVAVVRASKEVENLFKTCSVRFNPRFTDTAKKNTSIKSFSLPDITNEYIDRIYRGSVDKDLLKKEASKYYSQLSQLDSKSKT